MGVLHYVAFLRRILFVAITVVFALGIFLSPSRAQDSFGKLDIFDLVLQVKRGPSVLSEGIFAFEQGEQYFLPLTEIALLVDFPVRMDLEQNTIEGWFLKQDNTFHIDLEQNTYTVKDQPVSSL